jgi:hypothetical protein
MAHRTHPALVVASVAAVLTLGLGLAGCGIDGDQVARGSEAEHPTGSTTTTTPLPGTEPQSRAADGLLLRADELGSDWTAAGVDTIPDIPDCVETSTAEPLDHAQAVFVRGSSVRVLVQTVAVFGSEEQAGTALAGFRDDIESCDNPAIDVHELALPAHGDDQVTARLAVGEPVLDTTIDLVCVRVGTVVTVLTYVNLVEPDTEDLPPIVDAAVARL